LLPNFFFSFSIKKKKLSSFAPIMKFVLHLDLVLALLGFLLHYFQQIFFLNFKSIFLKKIAQVMIIHKNI
jgi:hypothetical protein